MPATIPYREIYCPAHFGNSYEVMWPREMRQYLAEVGEWGYNVYGDWFDNADMKNPRNAGRYEVSLSKVYRVRKIEHYRSARDLGYRLDLVLTPNHAFLDQFRPDLRADMTAERYFGQLLCPSIPEACEVILRNHRELFEDLSRAGVEIASLSSCPYDYGGCGCERCTPWIVTFGKLTADIVAIAREFWPAVEPRLIGWWWKPEEHEAFARWADDSGVRFRSLAGWIPDGAAETHRDVPYPAGCERHAFVHIGYGDGTNPIDTYGPWGPCVAPKRLAATVKNMVGGNVSGFMGYSEGVFDDVNKAILGGLTSGAYSGADEVLRAYAERYLGAPSAEKDDWAEWIAAWGEPFAVDTRVARETFDRLARNARPSWRLDQLEAKLRMFEADAAVRALDTWDAKRLAAADEFWAVREWMQRDVWRLGLVRNIFDVDLWGHQQPAWYREWVEHTGNAWRLAGRDAPART